MGTTRHLEGSWWTYLNPWCRVPPDRKPCCYTCVSPAAHRCTASRRARKRKTASAPATLVRTWGNTRSTATTPLPPGHLVGGSGIDSCFVFVLFSCLIYLFSFSQVGIEREKEFQASQTWCRNFTNLDVSVFLGWNSVSARLLICSSHTLTCLTLTLLETE